MLKFVDIGGKDMKDGDIYKNHEVSIKRCNDTVNKECPV
jgi:hypothetical protein